MGVKAFGGVGLNGIRAAGFEDRGFGFRENCGWGWSFRSSVAVWAPDSEVLQSTTVL